MPVDYYAFPVTIYNPYARRPAGPSGTASAYSTALVDQQEFPLGSPRSSLVVASPWHVQYLRDVMKLTRRLAALPQVIRLTALALDVHDESVT